MKKASIPRVSIRVIPEGVEEVKDYRFRLSPKDVTAFDFGETEVGALSLGLEEV